MCWWGVHGLREEVQWDLDWRRKPSRWKRDGGGGGRGGMFGRGRCCWVLGCISKSREIVAGIKTRAFDGHESPDYLLPLRHNGSSNDWKSCFEKRRLDKRSSL